MPSFGIVEGDNILPGQGFNSVSALHGGQAVEYLGQDDIEQVRHDVTGYQTFFNIQQIDTLQQLKETLRLSASASVGIGIYSGDASSSYFRSRSYNKFSSFVSISASVVAPTLVLKRSVMTQAGLAAAQAGLSRFLGFCGDSYCYGLQLGGNLTVIAEFSAESAQQHEDVSAAVSGAVRGIATAGGSFSSALETLSTISKFSMVLFRNGSAIAVPELSQLVEYSHRFPEDVAQGGARVIAALTRGYETTENFPHDLIDLTVLQRMSNTMNGIAGNLDRLYQAQGNLYYLSPRVNWYRRETLRSEIETAFAANEAEIGRLTAAVAQLRSDPEMDAPAPASVHDVDPGEPAVAAPPPVIVEVFEHDNYQGAKYSLTTSVVDFQPLGFNDIISSFKIYGEPGEYTVEFYAAGAFGGRRLTVQSPAEVPSLNAYGNPIPIPGGGGGGLGGIGSVPSINWIPEGRFFQDAISSIRIVKVF